MKYLSIGPITMSAFVKFLDRVTIALAMTREQLELFTSPSFRVFCDVQEQCRDRFITKNLKMYELVLVLIAGQLKDEQHELLTSLMDKCEHMREGDYLQMCQQFRNLSNAMNLVRQHIPIGKQDFLQFGEDDKELVMPLDD